MKLWVPLWNSKYLNEIVSTFKLSLIAIQEPNDNQNPNNVHPISYQVQQEKLNYERGSKL